MSRPAGRPAFAYSQAIRVVRILRALDNGDRVKAADVLTWFNITSRTLLRDINALRRALAPNKEGVAHERGELFLERSGVEVKPHERDANPLVEAALTALSMERAAAHVSRSVSKALASFFKLDCVRDPQIDDSKLHTKWSVASSKAGLTILFDGRPEYGFSHIDIATPGEHAFAFQRGRIYILQKKNKV